MIGTCILAVVFSPIFAEFMAFFNHDCRGFLRSDKTMIFGTVQLKPRVFRAILFVLLFIVIYPTLRWICGGGFSFRSDLCYVVSYMCFMAVVEPLIIYINNDEEEKTTPKEPFPDWFSMKTRIIMMSTVIVIGAGASPLIWSTCFKARMQKNPTVYAEFLKTIPPSVKKMAVWFATH